MTELFVAVLAEVVQVRIALIFLPQMDHHVPLQANFCTALITTFFTREILHAGVNPFVY